MVKGFADLAHLPEDDRILIIGETAQAGNRVGFFVEDDAKADRYIRKLTERFRVEVIERKADLIKNTVFVKVARKEGD